ncbi:hypothetical protein [Bradyrhizobium jicamae]|uniref:hypothetical protein n=1 Tax=Bradyrhizobium jicamae TaxID=280332 RepID=UPI003907F570
MPAQPPAAPGERGARELQRAAGLVSVSPVLPLAGPAVLDGPVRLPAAGQDVLELPQEAEASGVPARLVAVAPDAARQRAASVERERPAPDAASAFHPGQALPSAAPVRRPAARFVHAKLRRRTASTSAQSWQAARDEALS